MLDTIEIKIHDLQKHTELTTYLERDHARTGKTFEAKVTEEELTSTTLKLSKYLHFHDTGRSIKLKHINYLPSSHYELAYSIDYERDYIFFNFSIPKFCFGTNIIQLVPPFFKGQYNPYEGDNQLKAALKQTPEILSRFLKFFFDYLTPINPVHKDCVEISRLDFCFNLVFPSRESAFNYLVQLKKLKKKYLRETATNSANYFGGIQLKTDRYSFKVYHKGLEYKNNDIKQHKRINKEKGRQYFPTQELQTFSDKILRYELTVRKSYLDYLFKNYVFRKNDSFWQKYYPMFKRYEKDLPIEVDSKTYEHGQIPSYLKNYFAYIKSVTNKTYYYMLSAPREFQTETDTTEVFTSKPYIQRNIYFSNDLFKVVSNKFIEFCKEFTVSDLSNLYHLTSNHVRNSQGMLKNYTGDSDLYNYLSSIKLSPRKFFIFLDLLKDRTLDEIYQENILGRSTFYLCKKALKRLGFDTGLTYEQNGFVPFSFNDYQTFLINNHEKIRHLFRFIP
ncbi:phage/plasmid replication protein [Cytophagales bacterium LB-30]|uniref:Phage/plasmid replication protein n=1 Tax=Shiella aurantiaca TaxID=3058365 RepID=A0ABT8F0J3_9BACT|nr:phage/plasmid replication protein [Shiella aurantiaca]MDN4163966.1 phage/plasmid replication protein [Shiella aurantiaca]